MPVGNTSAAGVMSRGSADCGKPGETFQCWPSPANTLTVFLLWRTERSGDPAEIAGAEADAPADREFQHGRMRPHRAGKTQAPGNAAIGAGEFSFGEPVDVDAHGGLKNLASTDG